MTIPRALAAAILGVMALCILINWIVLTDWMCR